MLAKSLAIGRLAVRCCVIQATSLAIILLTVSHSIAYDASLAWEPSAGAAGYRLHVRYDAADAERSLDVGLPVTGSDDGLVRVIVAELPLGPTVAFAVAAYDTNRNESALSQWLSITYAQASTVSDSDGDGLTDAVEDSDLDGVVDAGETDPQRADSDGDGVSDGAEVSTYGTDPLDAASFCDPSTGRCQPSSEVWIAPAADPTADRRGAMTSDAAFTGGDDDDTEADALAAELLFALSTSNALQGGSGDEVRYQIELPYSGSWYVWGRFYYPGVPGSSDANSFVARVDDGPALTFGNSRDYYRRWHWGGDPSTASGDPQRALALGQLAAGRHTLAIEKREVVPVPPRLDVLVLTRDAAWRPSDEAALEALADLLFATTTTTTSSTTSTTTETNTTADTSTTTDTTTTTVVVPPPPPPPPTTTTTLPPTTTTLPAECSSADDCLDVDACTTDECVAGECVHAPASSGACDDGDPCTVGDACSAGACTGWPLDCSHLDEVCSYGVCDPETAECVATQVPEGTSCDDGSGCTTADACEGGVCVGARACPRGYFCHEGTQSCQKRGKVWLPAARDATAKFAGAMTSDATYAAGDDADLAADSLEAQLVFADSTIDDLRANSGDEVTYEIELPETGQWYVWARFYYPGAPDSRDANSFFVRIDDERALKFGNSRSLLQQWHWAGDGRVRSAVPRALALGRLSAGPHTLTVAKREVTPLAPRLDVLVLTQDPSWIPTDAEATAGLAALQ